MNTLHAKSPCCHAPVHRFGNRRRQCSTCKRTWSVWKKKQGRKPVRVHPLPQTLAFASHESLRHRAQRLHQGRERIRRRHARKIDLLLNRLPVPQASAGKLIVIIDGYQLFFGAHPWTLYLVIVRPVASSRATVLEPCLIEGQETIFAWENIFASLSQDVRERIHAVVADGILGLDRVAQSYGWVLQRCHVHLLRTIYPLLGNRWEKVTAKALRKRAFTSMLTVLTSVNEAEVARSIAFLYHVASSPRCPKRFGLKVRGFLRSYLFFRSYLTYPELNLPTSTNTAEMVCGKIAELVRRTRGYRNPQSFERWVKVLIRRLPPVRCNGKSFNREPVS